jgi:starch-binding outer membrane protein, SusD/RagB family
LSRYFIKIMKKIFLQYGLMAAIMFIAVDCQKDFLVVDPQDQITLDNFYKNAEQVNAATASMYGFPWFNLNDKTVYAIGDLMGGNLHTGDGQYRPFMTFSVRQDNPRLNEAWGSLFKVISFANSVINVLPSRVDKSVEQGVVDRAIGEAKFMRALAYFYLVRAWGPVPIIENSEALATGDFKVPRHRTEDIYKFMIRDLEAAAQSCPVSHSGADKGRVTSGAAKALLAKIYLYQRDYAKARQKAEEVVASNVYALMPNYGDIFKTKNDNNIESIFAWQWVACPDCWGQQNTNQAYFAPFGEGITETGDGWGSLTPSVDFQRAIEKDDKRRNANIMTPGAVYPELTSKTNPAGYKYPDTKFISGTHANIRKYIVGSAISPDGPVFFMRTGVNTNILRYAEVLLIHAEAIMGSNASTSDAAALASFNKVRQRAGLGPKQSITLLDILQERRVELFLEHDYWFDLGRIDRSLAKQIISNQERGTYYNDTDISSEKFTPTDADFLLPIPQSETDRNPLLLQPAVEYRF